MQRFRSVGSGVLVLLWVFVYSVSAQSKSGQSDPHYQVLHSFQGNPDGNGNFDPLETVGMTADKDGTIYGNAISGGQLGCFGVTGACLFPVFRGAQFKVDRDGHLTSFPNNQTAPPFPNQASQGPLLLDDSGNLIFATPFGGSVPLSAAGGVFSLDPNTGAIGGLGEFSGPPTDGLMPDINPIRDAAGNFYGTTIAGGVNPAPICIISALFDGGVGCGTVYKIDAKTHRETVLHTFDFDTDGTLPLGLALDQAGNLIGAAQFGDSTDCRDGIDLLGCGDIFRIDPSGNFSFVHEFHHSPICVFGIIGVCPTPNPVPLALAPPPSGSEPELLGWTPTWVTVDEEGNIFGTTADGGNFGLGVIFKIDTAGNYSVMHHFAGPVDGFSTQQLLLKDHQLYGLNADGGNTLDCDFGFGGCGTIFRLDTHTGAYTVLHTFSRDDEGTTPTALAFDQNGDLIGSNLFGGNGVFDTTVCTGGGGCGNVFRFKLTGDGQ